MQTKCRYDADKHKSLRLAHFFVIIAKYAHNVTCRLCADFCRHLKDIVQTIMHLYNWNTFPLLSVANFLTVLWFMQDLHGANSRQSSECGALLTRRWSCSSSD